MHLVTLDAKKINIRINGESKNQIRVVTQQVKSKNKVAVTILVMAIIEFSHSN